MNYENENDINKLLKELDITILDIEDIYTPTSEDINGISELYDIFD